MTRNKHTGGCLCGAVRFKIKFDQTAKNAEIIETTACHCSSCRKWASGAYMAVHCKNKVEFTGFENITIFKSSNWAERGFCKKCGSNLFYHLIDSDKYNMAAGSFDNQDNHELTKQYFIDKKPDYYQFSNDTVNLTEAEIFAIFAPKD